VYHLSHMWPQGGTARTARGLGLCLTCTTCTTYFYVGRKITVVEAVPPAADAKADGETRLGNRKGSRRVLVVQVVQVRQTQKLSVFFAVRPTGRTWDKWDRERSSKIGQRWVLRRRVMVFQSADAAPCFSSPPKGGVRQRNVCPVVGHLSVSPFCRPHPDAFDIPSRASTFFCQVSPSGTL
jgi:hypothetical protein